jgi:hypothetical protein
MKNLTTFQAEFAIAATKAELVLGKPMNKTTRCILTDDQLRLACKISVKHTMVSASGCVRLVIVFDDGSRLRHRLTGLAAATEAQLAQIRITSKF